MMKPTLQSAFLIVVTAALVACGGGGGGSSSDSGAAADSGNDSQDVETATLTLPSQLEVVTNEND